LARKKKEEIAIVEDNPGLIRDTTSNAIINTNNDAFSQRRAQLAYIKLKGEVDEQQRSDIDALKKDVQDIKNLLKELVSK
jgi:hypothetical protein|tara:strand:- start:567 stop:806 length:240 start_codon:yes stop_codon:yes gene_type:complete